MATKSLIFIFFLLLVSFSTSEEPPTAYEMLGKFSFPPGILPEGVTSYLLRDDGTFEVYLGDIGGDCSFKVSGGYLLDYRRKITGRVEDGAIRDLKGVKVKILFVWLGITDLVRVGNDLQFYVGPISASFDVENFEESPQCRCGFDCVNSAVADS